MIDTFIHLLGHFVTFISAYAPAPVIPHGNEFFDPKTKKITPADDSDDVQVTSILDAIALATEAGIVSRASWVKQFFADETVFRAFLEELDQYDYRIIDRWHAALMEVTGRKEEFNFITNAEVAAGLFESANKTGQL